MYFKADKKKKIPQLNNKGKVLDLYSICTWYLKQYKMTEMQRCK